MNLFQSIEETAKKGSAGLTPEARNSLVIAIQRHCGTDGGHTDLSRKHSDPYYSFFAWLSLRALSNTPPVSLEQYFATCRAQGPIDHFCKAFVQIHCMPTFKRKLASLCLLIRHPPHNPYALFLSGLLLNMSFPRLAPLLLRLTRTHNSHALSTSRLAAQLLANPRASDAPLLREKLISRHSNTGGFSSADNASPDLLATAVARIALSSESPDTSLDLLFTEACWCPDGLFSAMPGLSCGDVEHTYYALLVLGTCRT
jgi:prenyltransferase beta subunit